MDFNFLFFFPPASKNPQRPAPETEQVWIRGEVQNEINKYKSVSKALYCNFEAITWKKKKGKKKRKRGESVYVPFAYLCGLPVRSVRRCIPSITGGALLLSGHKKKSRFNSYCDKDLDVVESETCWAGAMWSRRESVALSRRHTAGALSCSSALAALPP